jgi:LPS-assembly protein
LPDVRLTGFRQQLGETPVYYESESSAGYYRRRFAETNGPMPGDFSAARADTFHQLLLPQTFFGWLNVTPRVGGRFTYYSKATGDGATTDEVYRGVFNTGAEISFKASRVWPGVQNKLFEMDGLRHIFEPSINYVFVPSPGHATNELPQFDYEVPSLRLLPIEYPDYNSIDSIDSQNVMRFGLRNKLQTKRQGRVEDLLNWDLYTDWRLKPNRDQTTFADLYSDLAARPRSWLKLESLTRFDLDSGNLRLSFHTLTFKPNNVWSWDLGHYYLRDAPLTTSTGLGQGNNLITSSMYYRVNENWGLRATHHFEARNGRMQEQFYSIYRDLRSWTAALTFRLRDNGTGPEDFTVAFTFSLKAHPRFGLGSDSVRPYSLLGG